MNRLVLQAQILETAAIRYTPAGLPALDLMLKHESMVDEAGSPRKVAMEIKAVALGDIVKRIQALSLTEKTVFTGFLSAQRQGRGTVFHITGFAD
ncbi:primosomal replication protein N [Roseateles sp. L2-2]|uniref:primosomal replication protein N n=1 Tax=Roseateles TaxID=93681 RepID=UPI003D3603D4